VLAFAIPGERNFILHPGRGSPATRNGVPALSEGKFLAVLHFRVLGDQGSLGYIADGLGEGLSAKFFQLRDLRLASPSAVEKANRNAPIEKTARSLGVNLVIHGLVQGNADKIRVIVNLEDIADGQRLWSQEFSGVSQDLLTLEDQIYAGLSSALELKPTSEELARGAVRPTENIEAYDLYLKGRNAMRGSQDVRNIQAAIRFYEDALKKDTNFALAYTGVADASLLMWRETKDSFWSQKALAAAQQAQRLNDHLPEVRFVLGSVYNTTGKFAEAIAELKRALELAPNSDEGYRRLGGAYLSLGRKEEAIQAYEHALSINPYYWVNQNALGSAYFNFGEFDKALAAFRRVTELEPNNAFGYDNIGSVYFRLGEYEECVKWFQQSLQIQPHYAAYSNLGTAYFFLKRYNEAVPMFEKAVEMNPNEQTAMGNLADAYRWSEKKEKAGATYDKAIALAFKELQVNPRSASTMGFLALYYAKKGDKARALDFIRRARSMDPTDVYLMYSQAQIAAIVGQTADALRYLRDAFAKKYPVDEALNDPELQTLQKMPEFDRLTREFRRKPE
jgi:tetratricopeptide (TPR) repeat protein